MATQTVHTDDAPGAIGPYSQAVVANGFLFTAGQIALDPATGQGVTCGVEAQTEQGFRNLSARLRTAGASWSDVVKATAFLLDMKDFARVSDIYASVIGDS